MEAITRFGYPTTIVYGTGAARELPEVLSELGITQPLLVTDEPLTRTPAFAGVTEVLSTAGLRYEVFSGVHPNPLDTDVDDALSLYTDKGCDGIIGLGGGSPLDAAKALAVLSTNGGTLSDYDV